MVVLWFSLVSLTSVICKLMYAKLTSHEVKLRSWEMFYLVRNLRGINVFWVFEGFVWWNQTFTTANVHQVIKGSMLKTLVKKCPWQLWKCSLVKVCLGSLVFPRARGFTSTAGGAALISSPNQQDWQQKCFCLFVCCIRMTGGYIQRSRSGEGNEWSGLLFLGMSGAQSLSQVRELVSRNQHHMLLASKQRSTKERKWQPSG